MLFCLNPACPNPENPNQNKYCHGCGVPLTESTHSYLYKGRYQIIKVLGEGAFGRTYLAEDRNFQSKRVIKKLIATGTGTNLVKIQELFEREAKKLDELKHPQIPRIYDYFSDHNSLYLIQEYIEGEDLYSEWEKEGNFSEEKIKQGLQDVLPILEYLHQNRILHRDIKPENIMRRKKDGKLFLIDFGGAKQTNQTIQSAPGTRLYTPGYASREHMRGYPKAASDIYSLGVTMVRLLTGCFPNFDLQSNMDDNLYDEDNCSWVWRDYAQKQGIKINPQLADVLDKMIEDVPKNRYQSATQILTALNNSFPVSKPSSSSVTPSTRQKTIIQKPPANLPITSVGNLPLNKTKTQQNTITRSSFLKWVGWGGAGVVITVVGRSIFANLDSNNNLQADKNFSFETVTVDNRGEVIDKEEKTASYFSEDLGDGINLDMVDIPGGTFMMGTEDEEIERLVKKFDWEHFRRESPQHEVKVKPFFMGKYPITQAQWRVIASRKDLKVKGDLETNPSGFKGDDRPVERVTWYDAVEFCDRLSKLTGKEYRLPSESEWEYACRAGTTTPFYFGETITTDLANYNGNYTYADEPKGIYREETTPVGVFSPNAFGLYDMHGNVEEWCEDDHWYYNYQGAPNDGSAWKSQSTEYTILRSGSWYHNPFYCRSAYRRYDNVRVRSSRYGFRVVCA